MRHLLWVVPSLMLISCGPEDEVAADETRAARAAVENATATMSMDDVPTLDAQAVLDAIAAQVANELDAQTRAPEERVFYRVDITTTAPVLPAPACPSCR